MKTLPLLNSDRVAIVDDDDFERVSTFPWKLHPEGYAAFRFTVNHRRYYVLLHHAIIGFPIQGLTDHKDGDPLNNQKSNLRHCSYSQNSHNMRTRRDGLKGVYFNKRSRDNPWVAQIVVAGRKNWLGSFPSESQAHTAYCVAAQQHFGNFARFA